MRCCSNVVGHSADCPSSRHSTAEAIIERDAAQAGRDSTARHAFAVRLALESLAELEGDPRTTAQACADWIRVNRAALVAALEAIAEPAVVRGCCLVCRRVISVETDPDRPGPLVPHARMAANGTTSYLCESYQAPTWLVGGR